MGLLSPEDWVARFIEPKEPDEIRRASPRPAHLFRQSFHLNELAKRGRLYATAHGIYKCFINGREVGNSELTPGFTSYWHSLHVQTYDVTDLLKPGENVVGAVVSDGWFRGQDSGFRLTNLYGDSVALLAQLNIEGSDRSLTRIGTGSDWTTGAGALLAADLIQGQTVDFRREAANWCAPGLNPDGWTAVTVRNYDLTRLKSSPAPPVRRVNELPPRSVARPRPDRQVIDLGQNFNGWIRLENLGPVGSTLTLTHGEALDSDGDVIQINMIPDASANPDPQDPKFGNMTQPFQVDRVTSSGKPGESFEPRHTTHGFRYVRVEGHPGAIRPEHVMGISVHTAMRPTGWFSCSDDRLNKLHEAALWSFRGNACDIPTDCPTRERAGWTGDWQIFVPTAAFLYDVAGFSIKWLRDLAAEQEADGRVFHCVPETMPTEVTKKLGAPHGSAGWGDAAVIVPWEIYCAYGDTDLLAEQWPSMTAWVDYAARTASAGRHPGRVAIRHTPGAHEEFIWDTGFHWGEWLEPDERNPNVIAALAGEDHGAVATAYLCYSSGLLARIAGILGRYDDAARYQYLAKATRAAWQAEFVKSDGTLTPDTQATYVRALAFNLASDELRSQLARRLVELIRKADTHLDTGFLATPYLLPVLADTGHLDVAYELLFQDSEPSWLTMIDRGATTMWEDWNGIDENGSPYMSLNHYSKGAVVSFLHRYTAGIRLLDDGPAYKRFQIAPRPGGGLTSACARHRSPYGGIKSSWRIHDDRFMLEVAVPPGTTAEVRLPSGRVVQAGPGISYYECVLPEL